MSDNRDWRIVKVDGIKTDKLTPQGQKQGSQDGGLHVPVWLLRELAERWRG